jgi:hypothetical protein
MRIPKDCIGMNSKTIITFSTLAIAAAIALVFAPGPIDSGSSNNSLHHLYPFRLSRALDGSTKSSVIKWTTIISIFQIAYPDIQISRLSDLLYVRRIYSHVHLILFFDLPFFHLDLSMEPSLEDELRLANLSVY